MNPVVLSSLLLAVPAYVAAQDSRVYDVAFMSLACTITSVLAHTYRSLHIFTTIDRIVVRTTGLYYCIKAILNYKNKFHALTLWFAALTVYLYITRPSYYFQSVIHVCSMVGMLCYIKAETL